MIPLNLASQPFRNERLGEVLFGAGAAALLAVTAWHALVIRDLLPARTSALHQEVAALNAERESLRREGTDRRTEAPPAPVLAQWNLVKELVDRRAFSWTGLFTSLEAVIPLDVRLTSITPAVRKGQVELQLDAVTRDAAAGWEFVRALEASDEFLDVYPTSEADREFRYKMRYRPRHGGQMVGPPMPTAEEDAAAGSADAGAAAASAPPAPHPSPTPSAAANTAAAKPRPLAGPTAPGKGALQ